VLVPVSAHGSASEQLRLGVHDLLDDGEQVEGAAREAVDARDDYHIARGKEVEQFEQFPPVAERAITFSR
jgi:hypothetical protein